MARTGHGGTPTGTDFVNEAGNFIGTPYQWGGASPGGFDCSGLVEYSLEQIGIRNAPRTSEEQWAWVDRISQSQLQPGDLVFEQWPGEQSPGHVAIYAGGGQIIQAPSQGEDVQRVKWSPSIVHQEGGQIVGYGRVPGLSYSGEPAPSPTPGGTPPPGGTQPAPLTAGQGGFLGSAGSLFHGLAVVLDRFFALFAPGQGWRIIFGITAAVMLFLSFRSFTVGVF